MLRLSAVQKRENDRFHTYSNPPYLQRSYWILHVLHFGCTQTLPKSHFIIPRIIACDHNHTTNNVSTALKCLPQRSTKQQMTNPGPTTTNSPRHYASLQIAHIEICNSTPVCTMAYFITLWALSYYRNQTKQKRSEWLSNNLPPRNTKTQNVISHTNKPLTSPQRTIAFAMHCSL